MRLLLILALVGLCLAQPHVIKWTKLENTAQPLNKLQENSLRYLWDQFVKVFNHMPTMTAFRNFKENVARMWHHQTKTSSFVMGINKFSAMVSSLTPFSLFFYCRMLKSTASTSVTDTTLLERETVSHVLLTVNWLPTVHCRNMLTGDERGRLNLTQCWLISF